MIEKALKAVREARILTKIAKSSKIDLPKGKLTIRFRQMRGVWQAFSGKTYLAMASGETPEEVIEQIKKFYNYNPNTSIRIYGYSKPYEIKL